MEKCGGRCVRSGGGNGVGPGGKHVLRALFPSLKSAHAAHKELLALVGSISMSPTRTRRGGLVSIPSLRQRLGKILLI